MRYAIPPLANWRPQIESCDLTRNIGPMIFVGHMTEKSADTPFWDHFVASTLRVEGRLDLILQKRDSVSFC